MNNIGKGIERGVNEFIMKEVFDNSKSFYYEGGGVLWDEIESIFGVGRWDDLRWKGEGIGKR